MDDPLTSKPKNTEELIKALREAAWHPNAWNAEHLRTLMRLAASSLSKAERRK